MTQEVKGSDLLIALASSGAIPTTSIDHVGLILDRVTHVPRYEELLAIMDTSSELRSLSSIVKYVERNEWDLSTTCGALLIVSEKTDHVRRRRIRDKLNEVPLGDWPKLFKEIATQWLKSEPHIELLRLHDHWKSCRETHGVTSYLAEERDVFEQLTAYARFIGSQPPADSERSTRLLKNLKRSSKERLASFLREKSQRTELLSFSNIVLALEKTEERHGIKYSWLEERESPREIEIYPRKCQKCGRRGHETEKCYTVSPTPRAPIAVTKCAGCGIAGHSMDQCWKIHAHLRPKRIEGPQQASPMVKTYDPVPRTSEFAAKAPPPTFNARKPITRSDTRREPPLSRNAFGIRPAEEEHQELVVETDKFYLWIDTLSYYSICSKTDAEKFGKVRLLDAVIPVKTFDGNSALTGTGDISLTFPSSQAFDMKIYTVDRPLMLDKSKGRKPTLILGLKTLQRMGAIIDIPEGELRLRHLNVSLPLTDSRGHALKNKTVSIPWTPASDITMDEYITNKIATWEPLRAECRLKDNTPPQHLKPYPVPPTEVENMKTTIRELVAEGVLRPTTPTSESFISPAFLRKKADGGRRLVVNVQALNNCQEIADLDLPCSMEALKHVDQTSKWFAVVDVSGAFHTVPYRNDISRKLHTICVLGQHYEYTHCVQGDTNSPAYWMKHLQGLLLHVIGVGYTESVIPYVDDILIHAATEEECLWKFRFVIKTLEAAGKKISASQAPSRSVTICGMRFSENGWQMSEESYATMLKLLQRTPRTIKDLRSALGAVNYLKSGYGHPGKNLSALTDQFYKILSEKSKEPTKNPVVHLDTNAWKTLIESYQGRPLCFTKFEPGSRFCVMVDAADHYCGGALFTIDSDVSIPLPVKIEDVLPSLKLVDVFSKRFSPSEQNWAVFERESFTIVLALRRWANILWNSPEENILLFTDSLVALSQWKKLKPPEKIPSQRRWQSWYEELCLYDLRKIVMTHVAGTDNSLADMLSRMEGDENIATNEHDPDVLAMTIRPTTTPPTLSARERLEEAISEDFDDKLFADDSKMVSANNMWYRKDLDINDIDLTPKLTLYVPERSRTQLITKAHSAVHLGWKSTYTTLRSEYFWPSMRADVKQFVKKCGKCVLLRTEATSSIQDTLAHRAPVGNTFKVVFVDHFHDNGNICLTCCCQFSGYTMFYDVQDETADTASRALLKWIAAYGIPERVISDLGPAFDSQIWKNLAEFLNFETSYTSVRNPRANLAERPHRLLRLLCNDPIASRDWQTTLSLASLHWNNSRAAEIAPAQVVFGRFLVDPFIIDNHRQEVSSTADPRSIPDYIHQIQSIKRALQQDAHDYDVPATAPPLVADDYVRAEGRIGKVIKVGHWSALIEWETGSTTWHRFGSLRKIQVLYLLY